MYQPEDFPFHVDLALTTRGTLADSLATRDDLLADVVRMAMDAVVDLFWVWDNPDKYTDHDGLVTKGLYYDVKEDA